MKDNIFNFNNSFSKLPNDFFERICPVPVKKPELIDINQNLATFLKLDSEKMKGKEGNLIFAGNTIPKGSDPLAMVYAGHQFGHFVSKLGDGRAVLLGEIFAKNGKRFDVQLKGSGRTSFSRNGDGRAPLGPILREYIVSEAMAYLKVPSTRVLSISKTGEFLQRENIVPGGILTRIASSHIRIGTFEYFAYLKNYKSIKILADYTIERHFPEIKEGKNKYLKLFKNVMLLQAKLVSSWMNVGFIHGVMNTDNTSIGGETIDYGPCAFMDFFNSKTVYSYIDTFGRYSYGNQPKIVLWNLSKFGECIATLIDENIKNAAMKINSILEMFPERFNNFLLKGFREKMGLHQTLKKDDKIISTFISLLEEESPDFTICFRKLSNNLTKESWDKEFLSNFKNKTKIEDWLNNWKKRILKEKASPQKISKKMQRVNPIYIARNHLIETAIKNIIEKSDYSDFKKLLSLVRKPYTEKKNSQKYSIPPNPNEVVINTFCGT